MSLPPERDRLEIAYHKARQRLLDLSDARGVWSGAGDQSPLATAAAIGALAAAERHVDDDTGAGTDAQWLTGVLLRTELTELIGQSLRWLANRQNNDGGWGDCEGSVSTVTATTLVEATLRQTGVPAKYSGAIERAAAWLAADETSKRLQSQLAEEPGLAGALLVTKAAADLIPWRKAPSFPVERLCWSGRWRSVVGKEVRTDQAPLYLAAGIARSIACPSINPLSNWLRSRFRQRALKLLESMQSPDGSFFALVTSTSLVVTCLASVGLADHPIVRNGVEFLLATVGRDGAWPLSTDFDIRSTAVALDALGAGVNHLDSERSDRQAIGKKWLAEQTQGQTTERTTAASAGWSWTNNGCRTVGDTAAAVAALLANDQTANDQTASDQTTDGAEQEVARAATATGIESLLQNQFSSGGWPLLLQDSAASSSTGECVASTAEALITLSRTAQRRADQPSANSNAIRNDPGLLGSVIARAVTFLFTKQSADGSWSAALFGNQHSQDGQNKVFATARVLSALTTAGRAETEQARRAAGWLASVQHLSGGWGPSDWKHDQPRYGRKKRTDAHDCPCSLEETAVVVAALLPFCQLDDRIHQSTSAGLHWLVETTLNDHEREPAVIRRFLGRFWQRDEVFSQAVIVRSLIAALALGDRLSPQMTAAISSRP